MRVALLFAFFFGLSGCAGESDTSAQPGAHTSFEVYFNNSRLAPQNDPTACEAVFPVERSAPTTEAVATAALTSLFSGPSSKEREEDYYSPFSNATADLLKRVRIEDGTAYVDLHDLTQTLSGVTSSCGSASFYSEIERTLRQLPDVRRVIYAIEGDPTLFYSWMESECGPENDDCNPEPFSFDQ